MSAEVDASLRAAKLPIFVRYVPEVHGWRISHRARFHWFTNAAAATKAYVQLRDRLLKENTID